ncbi:MAG: DUF2442 domain-containing protein [Saprospiraceae bacterium]|nr:DUF2442 domain-containing protein [Saprospiraceae bacterium]HMW38815.1 DUF2442 domain-containing protein [Saprospiraceae bacterium]HMX88904.1 DUF2442 domain-containing protein [Saprospiraceae bacterium]HMZ40309.1 DUF2442 domain-containing protein [Saprospiraceae bacterium]HNA63337.1 DUF2442 domain-containing protein [Saprospiraceae bacterium]
MELVWVTKAEYIKRYKIKILFNGMTEGIVDLENLLKGPVFEPLKEESFFKQFSINSWTLEWPNGADFAPEYLYQLAKELQLEHANK